jgi:transcriptional regulator with XRE-family HTH domain
MSATGKNDIVSTVAINVRRARLEAGLSQEQLAHEAGIDRTYVSQVEREKRNVTITVLARLAAALGTTPDQLLVSHSPTRKRTPTRQ